MRKIDDYLMDILRDNNYDWLKKIIGFGKIKVEPSAFIGDRRNVDLLVTIIKYNGKRTQKVAVEIENDREFDVDAVLRKIKKDQPCPTIAIIPIENEKDAWRFQENLIKVWLWRVACKWKRLQCNHVFRTNSSVIPTKCETCKKGGNIILEDIEHDDKPFVEADNNPSMSWMEIQTKLRGAIDAWRFG